MNEPESFDDMITPDEAGLHFTPLGLTGGLLSAEDAVTVQRGAIERARLHDDVPEELRQNWTRLRKLHLYGVLEYELFSAAHDFAYLILDGAMRVRFVTFYDGSVPVVDKAGKGSDLKVSSFEQVRKAPAGLTFRTGRSAGHPIPRGLLQLFHWARRERLLVGQRSASLDDLFVNARNRIAHPEQYQLGMPPDSSWLLLDVAELINKLWGFDMPSGRLFHGKVQRRVRAIGLSPTGDASVEYPNLERLAAADSEHHDWTFAVFLAAHEERLTEFVDGGIDFAFKEGFELTNWPCERIWGPGPLGELLVHLATLQSHGDDIIDFVDRIFVIREHADTIDPPRTLEQFAALRPGPADERWYAVQADHAWDAYRHAREHASVSNEPLTGRCGKCSVTDIGRFDSRDALEDFLSGR